MEKNRDLETGEAATDIQLVGQPVYGQADEEMKSETSEIALGDIEMEVEDEV